MRTAKEIYNKCVDTSEVREGVKLTIIKAIQQAQTEAYNQALEEASRVIDGWPTKIMTISEEQDAILALKK
jgi:hypothetical protein